MDAIFKSFLEEQEAEASELASRSDLFELLPMGSSPYQHYLVRFGCRGLVDTPEGIVEAELFDIGVYFPLDYWQRVNPAEVITLLGPTNTFHPNVLFPYVSPGRLTPGTSLTDIIMQCFEILTYQKQTMREDDALNTRACAWARRHPERFPVDDRPIAGRPLEYRIRETETIGEQLVPEEER